MAEFCGHVYKVGALGERICTLEEKHSAVRNGFGHDGPWRSYKNKYPTGEAFQSIHEAMAAINDDRKYTLAVDEGQRQMLLLALAKLSTERQGFTPALWEIAGQVDEADRGHSMFEKFRVLHTPAVPTEVR
jgi:hypothetical protein